MTIARTYLCSECARPFEGEGECPHCTGSEVVEALPAPAPPAGWPVLSPEAFYGLPARVVHAIGQDSEADPVALLITFLTFFTCAVGPSPHVVTDGTTHTPRLFTCLVGNTSKARKGTSLGNVAGVFERAEPAWTRDRLVSGCQSGEAVVAAVADRGPDDDSPAPDRRCLLVEEEFARALAVAGREGNVLSQLLRSAWDGRTLQVRTKTSTMTATGHHVSALAHTTAAELVRRLDDTELANGMANRWLWPVVIRSRLLPSGGGDVDPVRDALGRTVRTALCDARKVSAMRRTTAAEALWRDLYVMWADDDSEDLVGALTARVEAQVLRLSMAYALTDGTGTIDVQHIEAADAVWRYNVESIRWIFGDRLGDPDADRLLAALVEAGADGLDFTAQSRVLKNRRADQIGRVRDLLKARGLVRTEQEDTGGRPRSITYHLRNMGEQG